MSKKRKNRKSHLDGPVSVKKFNFNPLLLGLGLVGLGALVLSANKKLTPEEEQTKKAFSDESPTAQATPNTVKIITDYDPEYGNQYDYKYQDNRWYARPKGKDYWLDVQGNLDNIPFDEFITKMNRYLSTGVKS